ncbi:YadA-like family protein [Brucella intermedia]|uniref:YadA-like family protein n=1 Tax=Brucella intermedia TaxID=94625 RepID=UPI00235ED444|nr:YadA-like family protein [Brucella intermedia]
MYTKKMTKIALLAATAAFSGAFFLNAAAFAAPTVTGKGGCIMDERDGVAGTWQPGSTGGSDGGGSGSSGQSGGGGGHSPIPASANYHKCNTSSTGTTADGRGTWVHDNFATADEVNAAFEQAYRELGGQTVDLNPIITKNNEQDVRIGDHDRKIGDINTNVTNLNADLTNIDKRVTKNEGDITNINANLGDHEKRITKNEGDITTINNTLADHQSVLNNHEQRITRNESDIAGIQNGAVFYNRDENGHKTGGVTFNDGTGNPVQLGHVAAGKEGKDAVNVDQLTAALDGLGGGAAINVDGSITGPTYNIGGKEYHNVSDALGATNNLGVQYIADENGKPTNTVLLIGNGTGAPVTITNLADGVADSDAVNVRQLRASKEESFAYTDQEVAALRDSSNSRFEALTGELQETRQEARAGIAAAMAASGLRYDDRPGKASIAAGMGGFKSATAIAAGVGYTSQDGRWRSNAALSHSFSTHDTAWNAGVSWTFN